jgi:hypothetical protein
MPAEPAAILSDQLQTICHKWLASLKAFTSEPKDHTDDR